MARIVDRRLFAGSSLLLVVIAVGTTMGYRTTAKLNEDAARVVHTQEVLNRLDGLLSVMKDAETGQRGFLITGDERYLEPYRAALAGVHSEIATLRRLTKDNAAQQARLLHLEELVNAKLDVLARTIDIRHREGFDAARHDVESNLGKFRMDAIRAAVGAMEESERHLLRERQESTRHAYRIVLLTRLGMTSLMVLSIVAFSWLLHRALEERRKAAAVAHEQREWLRTTLGSIGDGVIATDTEGHLTFLNAVAEGLTGWTEAEANGQPVEHIFQIVNEETRRTVENPIIRALTEGTIVGLANHTVLIAKDGTERPIDDSAAPIRDEAGRVIGCVLVFRDITARRREENERRQRLNQLAEAEERMRAVVNNVVDGIITIDEQGTVQTFNPAAERQFGYTQAEVIGRKIHALMPEPYRSEHDTYLANYLRTGVAKIIGKGREVVGRRKDGSTFPMDLAVSEFRIGTARYFSGVVRDITERKASEEALREQAQLLELAHDAIIVRMTDGRITYWNSGAKDLYGWSGEEAAGQITHTLLRTEFPLPLHAIEAELAEQGWWSGTLTHTRRDGTTIFVASRWALRQQDGRPAIILEINQDITARKQAEESLRESEKQLRLALEAGKMGNWVWDLRANKVVWSPAVEALHGLAPGTFGGNLAAFESDIHPDDRETVRRSVQRSMEHGDEHRVEYRVVWPDGSVHWVEGRGQLLRDEQGVPVRMVGVCGDITERKTAEETLRDADRRKDEFLATLAHELRNPLASLRIGAELLLRAQGEADLIKEASIVMDRQTRMMVRLVDDLMDMSRIAQGKIELRRKVVDLASVLRSAAETCRPAIDASGQEFTLVPPREPVLVQADATRLAQVFTNLLTNAAKYSSERGSIRVSVECDDGQAVVSVKDHGIGIAADMLPRIFDLFTQVDRDEERSHGGLGIGLSLVKRLVELHGGTVEARSEGLGKGSEFVVRLPICVETKKSLDAPMTSDDKQPLTPRRVLIVDDDQDSANMLAILLQRHGHETQVVYDGLAAIAVMKEFGPDAVLLDIGLPKLDGLETCRHIREQSWGQNILLIAISGWVQEEDRRKSRDAGFDVHLMKPVDFESLAGVLGAVPRQR